MEFAAHSTHDLDTDTLDRAVKPEDLLGVLLRFGLQEHDIAQVTGTNARTVRRWKVAKPKTKPALLLAQLKIVIVDLRMSDAIDDRTILFWLRSPNRHLLGYDPLSVIWAGGFASVRDAADSYVHLQRAAVKPLPQDVVDKLEGIARNEVQKTA